jgi:hypothetical protein
MRFLYFETFAALRYLVNALQPYSDLLQYL